MTDNAATISSKIKSTTIPSSPFPTRILKLIRDEEEWISGSELKTDNSSSSDDEMSPTSQNVNKKCNKIKKRRKSKVNLRDNDYGSESSAGTGNSGRAGPNEISSGKMVRGTTDEKHTNLLCASIAESDEDDTEIYWRPKREVASMNLLRDHPDLTNSFTTTEQDLENVSIMDQPNDLIQEATKRMKSLEWDFLQAECRFEKEKEATRKVADDMQNFLNEISSFEGESWNYIRDVIKQWIYYLNLNETVTENDGERLVSKQLKRNINALVRNRTKSKLGFVKKNIESAKLTNLKSNMRLPALSKEDKMQLDDLVKKSSQFAINEYKFHKSENDQLNEINSKLSLCRLEDGASVVLNSSKNDAAKLEKFVKKSQNFQLHDNKIRKQELDDKRAKLVTHLKAVKKNDEQFNEMCKQFAVHEYNLPKFDFNKLKEINSKASLKLKKNVSFNCLNKN